MRYLADILFTISKTSFGCALGAFALTAAWSSPDMAAAFASFMYAAAAAAAVAIAIES